MTTERVTIELPKTLEAEKSVRKACLGCVLQSLCDPSHIVRNSGGPVYAGDELIEAEIAQRQSKIVYDTHRLTGKYTGDKDLCAVAQNIHKIK